MTFLEDFEANLHSLPSMLHRCYTTMRNLDSSLQVLVHQNEQRCEQEIVDLKVGHDAGTITADRAIVRFSDDAIDEQKHCIRISDEKVTLATRAYDMVDAQIQQLDHYMKRFEDHRQERTNTMGAGASGANADVSTRSGRGSESSKGGRKKTRLAQQLELPSVSMDLPVDPNEPTYCFCNQVSYGEMVACDNSECKIEWFHFGCVGLKEQPKGKWFCSECTGKQKRRKYK
ncbi:PHD finger protein ING1 [Zostera marina]|uniref:PHD finger protein ING n=1 Tax=Zostera marina TaxID=29655 RepID=A0A0K9P7K0_ZOSMR|nr:PHD finger protein ING1 [Zostera marina]